ncbi:MAG: hypothetical protein HY538_03745 [Deltaproteobacteria bacterium]|nr:hypothetical protein [Deltaproteobacteria bacterium]
MDFKKLFSKKKKEEKSLLSMYEEKLKASPGDDRLRLKVIDLRIAAGQVEEAVGDLRELVDRYVTESSFGKAIAVLRRLLTLGLSEPEIHLRLGELLQRGSLPNEAQEEFKKGIATALIQGKEDLGVEIVRRWIVVDPSSVEAHFQLATLYGKSGPSLQRQAELERLEQMLLQQGRESELAQWSERSLENDLSDVWGRRVLGTVRVQEGRFEEGIERLESLVREGILEDRVMEPLIQAHVQLGQKQEATEHLERWIESLQGQGRSDKITQVRSWFDEMESGRQISADSSASVTSETPVPAATTDHGEREKQIDSYLQEAELCWDYGLSDRAYDQIYRAFQLAPENPLFSTKVLDWAHEEEGEIPKESLLLFAGAWLERGEVEKAKEILDIAVKTSPGDEHIKEALSFLKLG